MVKIFIGNLVEGGAVSNDDVKPLFEVYGTVTECEVIKNHGYGFVHMDSEQAAKNAVRELNGQDVKGRNMKVEFSNSKGSGRKNTQKVFVGNIADGTSDQELRGLFEPHGTVTECDVISDKNFGFVHIDSSIGRGKISQMVRELNGYELNGNKIRVQLSTGGGRGDDLGGMRGGGGRGGRGSREGGYGRGRRDAPYPPSQGRGFRHGGYEDGYGGYGRFEEDSFGGSGFGGRYDGRGGYGSGGGPMRGYGDKGFAEDYPPPMGYEGGYGGHGGYEGYGGHAGYEGYGDTYGAQAYGGGHHGGYGAGGGRRGQGGPNGGGGRGAYRATWSS